MVTADNKRIAQNTIALYIRMFITILVGLYTSRIILEVLGATDYGIYNVVCGLVTIFYYINTSLASGTQRFLNIAIGIGDTVKVKQIFSTAFFLHLILSVLIIILIETIGLWLLSNKLVIPANKMQDAFWIFQFSVVVCALQITQVPYSACIIAHERMRIYAYLSIWDALSKLGIASILYFANSKRLILYGFFLMIQQIVTMLIYRIYCIRNFQESHISKKFDKKEAKKMIVFSSWNIMGCMAVALNGQGINILLNMFFGPVINAARAISMQIYNITFQFASNFQIAVNPQIVKLYARKDYLEMYNLISNNVKYATFLLLIMIVPIITEIDFILHVWLGDDIPEYTAVFSRIILFQCLIATLSRPLVTAIHAIGRMKTYSLVSGSVLLLILPTAYLLLKMNFTVVFVYIVCVIPWIFELCFCIYYVNLQIQQSTILFLKNIILKTLGVCLIASLGFIVIHKLMDFGWKRLFTVLIVGELWMLLIIYNLGIDYKMKGLLKMKGVQIIRSLKLIC